MSQENVEVVRRNVKAWNRRDLATWSALFHSDAEIDWSRARGPFTGVYRGHGEREAFWDVWLTVEDARAEAHGLTEAGSEVVVPNTSHFRGRDGIEVVARSAFGVHGRERADHSPSDVPRASRCARSGRAAGVVRELV